MFWALAKQQESSFGTGIAKLVPDVWLVVAGTEAPGGQTQSTEYMALAEKTGVSDRCRWIIGYLHSEEVANLFNACDAVALTYSDTFGSGSGVLSVAAHYGLPVLGSSGEGALKHALENYSIGLFIKPDDADAVAQGMVTIFAQDSEYNWEKYRIENSWQKNAALVSANLYAK